MMLFNNPKRTGKRSLAGILCLTMAVAVAGCGSSDSHEGDQELLDEHDEQEQVVRLTKDVLNEFNIEVSTAAPGTLTVEATFPGEVRVNQDRFAHIVPRVAGVVHSVNKSVGDPVSRGDILAILDSGELADVKSTYLASSERLELAEAIFRREEQLYESKISSQQEYLEARQGYVEANIALRSARQKLLSFGFSEGAIKAIPGEPEHSLVHYELVAPFDGVIVDRHISEGEAIPANAEAFALADLRTVWVDLSVFQKDLDLIRDGQRVRITSTGRQITTEATIQYVQPIVGEETRTATARIVLDNGDGRWKPGAFVTGAVVIEAIVLPIVVPKSALISLDNDYVVFVETDDGFKVQTVTIGRESLTESAIEAGLEPGMRYVSEGGFALKAELGKSELGEGHGH
jgi:cobalt-zinc-cadmium efflux system membrane fusion protein